VALGRRAVLAGGRGGPAGGFAAASFRVGLSEGHVPRARGFVLTQ